MENIKISASYFLREWRLSDLDSFLDGISDSKVDKNLRSKFPRTKKQVIRFLKKASSKRNTQDFAIMNEESLVGGISFIIHKKHRIELSCLWIARSYRGQGLGKNVINALIDFILQKYVLFNIIGQVYEFNTEEISMVKEIGFQEVSKRLVPYKDTIKYLFRYEYHPSRVSCNALIY